MLVKRYITREVFHTLLIVTTVLVIAFLSQQVVRYLNNAAVGKISTNILVELISFEIPYLLAMLLPLGLYIAVMVVYGRFYADNEMSILNRSGGR